MPPGAPSECDTFELDLAALGNHALRTKYPREAKAHQLRKAYCAKHGWRWSPVWSDFRPVLRDMGPKPSPAHSLDRLDPELLEYGPGLCRWATKLEQTENRLITRRLEFRERSLTIKQFADELGMTYKSVHSALARGKTPDEIARS